ncbi:hypothetical protein C8J57DRAFT_1356862, partial [Mycena rebaudengoi]
SLMSSLLLGAVILLTSPPPKPYTATRFQHGIKNESHQLRAVHELLNGDANHPSSDSFRFIFFLIFRIVPVYRVYVLRTDTQSVSDGTASEY